MILGSFYWGYIITHIPGGILAEKFGGKYVFSGGLLAAGILTILTPMAVHLGKFEKRGVFCFNNSLEIDLNVC